MMPFWRSSLLLQVYTSLLFFYVAVFLSCLFCLCKLSFHFFFFLQKVEGAQESVYPAERRLSIFKIKHEKSLREQTITCRSICQILSSRKLKKARKKNSVRSELQKVKKYDDVLEYRLEEERKCKCVSN